ncbi:hypothetical protein [Streptomyces sp. NRRL F-5135]|uniref:hypothetical protein n=1 Tax=Streptomyces sp. NRRL F-5135 TaxID=1463858 RepID=UPI0004C6781C|nr:hypothetical protein [Streptomyces sp. NRRL F-5135]
MSVARRPLLTATAAGTLLCALWFVPSANATGETGATSGTGGAGAAGAEVTGDDAADTGGESGDAPPPVLADTGAVDTTPYLFGGTAFLLVGAGFVTYSVHRGARTPL